MQQLKQSILAFALIVCGAMNATAQATPDSLRADSVLLSVFNTGAKYRLTPATFAPRTTGAELLTEMVVVQDTIVSFVETGSNGTTFLPPSLLAKMPDSLRQAFENQRLMKPVVTHRCDKPITADVKGRVVIMSLGTCDPSLMCLNAQRAGAKAIVLIHPNNHRDSILLKTQAVKKVKQNPNLFGYHLEKKIIHAILRASKILFSQSDGCTYDVQPPLGFCVWAFGGGWRECGVRCSVFFLFFLFCQHIIGFRQSPVLLFLSTYNLAFVKV